MDAPRKELWSRFLFALLLCRGVIVLGNETYGLEPVPRSATNEHLLYLLRDIQSDPVTCGVVGDAAPSGPSHEPFEPSGSLTSLLRVCVAAVKPPPSLL